jgi:hypothetical protein
MGTHRRAVQDQVFHVRLIDKVGVHSFPDAFVTPAGTALVHTVPVSILGGQQTPLGTAPGDPQHTFDKLPTPGLLADVHIRACTQEAKDS